MQRDPLLPDHWRPLGISWHQWAQFAHWSLVVAAVATILVMTFADVAAREAWLWSRLLP
jgi:hypothetical protein